MSWAAKRRLAYIGGFFLVFFILFGYPIYQIFHQPATCFDNQQNENEKGVDCDGPCNKLCKPLELAPVSLWQNSFKVETGMYTAAAYVENSNLNAEAFKVPYTFNLYDDQGALVATQSGTAHIPPGKNFAIVDGPITVPDGKIPVRTTFQFGNDYTWYRARTNLPLLSLSNLVLAATTSPTVDADIYNPDINPTKRVDVTVVVYDDVGNAVAASKTYLDSIAAQSTSHVAFTWPLPFPTQSRACEAPLDVMLALDRSGSIVKSLPDIKSAAENFVATLSSVDQAGLVSFATTPSSPIDSTLSGDLSSVEKSIQAVSIHSDGTQYTNIADTISAALAELSSSRHNSTAKAILVLLTDGIPNLPEKKGDATFATQSALQIAATAKDAGIEIFTIGLGSDIDSVFLTNLASKPSDFYTASSSKQLASIYTSVSQSICVRQPVRVEVTPDMPGN